MAFDVGFIILALTASTLEWYDFFAEEEKWRWLLGVWFAVIAVVKVFDIVDYLRKRKNLQSNSNEISKMMRNEKIG